MKQVLMHIKNILVTFTKIFYLNVIKLTNLVNIVFLAIPSPYLTIVSISSLEFSKISLSIVNIFFLTNKNINKNAIGIILNKNYNS